MPGHEPIQRVRIYLSERDLAEGQPLYLAVLERLQREGATGATALRGVAGFGAGHRLRSAGAADFSQSPPVVIEWVDRTERIGRVLPALDELLPDALITIEDLQVHRAMLRSAGLFGERSVGEVMERDIPTVSLGTPAQVAAELLERGRPLVPVLDERDQIVGVISGGDLLRRGGLALPPRLFGALAPPERAALLQALADRQLTEIMTTEPRTIYIEASIPHAIGTLVEWGLNVLPVTDRQGQLAGLFGVEQALRAALEARAAAGGAVRADASTPVQLVMQTAVPAVAATAPLATALAQLLAATAHFLVVVDEGRPVGMLRDAQILGRLQEPLRSAWLASLRGPGVPLEPALEFTTEQRAGDLADPPPTVSTSTPQDEAMRQMLDQGHEQLVVVDDQGRLAGLLARRGLLRALAQESAG